MRAPRSKTTGYRKPERITSTGQDGAARPKTAGGFEGGARFGVGEVHTPLELVLVAVLVVGLQAVGLQGVAEGKPRTHSSGVRPAAYTVADVEGVVHRGGHLAVLGRDEGFDDGAVWIWGAEIGPCSARF